MPILGLGLALIGVVMLYAAVTGNPIKSLATNLFAKGQIPTVK